MLDTYSIAVAYSMQSSTNCGSAHQPTEQHCLNGRHLMAADNIIKLTFVPFVLAANVKAAVACFGGYSIRSPFLCQMPKVSPSEEKLPYWLRNNTCISNLYALTINHSKINPLLY